MASRTRRAQVVDPLALLESASPRADARRAARAAADALAELAATDVSTLALVAGDIIVARQLDQAAAALEVLRCRMAEAAASRPRSELGC